MEGNFNCAANMDDDQEGDQTWREILQKWDEQGLNNMMNDPSMQQPTCASNMMLHTGGLAMESLNPVFYAHPPTNNPSSMVLNPSLISTNQPNSASNQPLMALEVINDTLNSSATSLNTIGADNLISTVRQQDELSSCNNLRSSWFSTFVHSLQSHPGGLASSSSSYNNLLNVGDDPNRGLAASPQPQSNTMQFNASLQQQAAGSSLDDILEQMSNDFINYGTAGSLQEQLTNALSASNVMGNTTAVMKREATVTANENNVGTAHTNMMISTPASSVSSDGGPDDDSSSHEDMSTALDQLDDFMMQSGGGPNSQLQNLSTSTPLPSSDTTSSQAACTKAETSTAPNANDQEQLKKRVSKPARVTKKPKRERGQKLAIKIQSDVEVLDDGYKWRKYGQKPVKNSPYPRSYYKCTDKQCKVKKHVERQAQEPEYVVTTYEGVHNHSRPDQQLQVLQSQNDVTSHQHDSFQPFVPVSSTHNLSPMELLGLRPSSLFPPDSQQQTISSTQNALQSIDQGILQTLFQAEPRTSSI